MRSVRVMVMKRIGKAARFLRDGIRQELSVPNAALISPTEHEAYGRRSRRIKRGLRRRASIAQARGQAALESFETGGG